MAKMKKFVIVESVEGNPLPDMFDTYEDAAAQLREYEEDRCEGIYKNGLLY